tara:strand:+ start:183187 stop:183720 length:534 start_codon:yes stop_codon:yes gene_type:complete
MMRTLLLATLLLLPLLGTAQIYKSTDDQGNVSYSDTPPASGPSEQVKLQETNSTPAPDMVAPAASSNDSADEEEGAEYSVSITSPANETTIPMGPGNFSISASVEPALSQGALLQLYVDGSPSGNPQSSNSWTLTNVFRGAHDLKVAVVSNRNDPVAESEAVRVYVLRPSTNFKNRN